MKKFFYDFQECYDRKELTMLFQKWGNDRKASKNTFQERRDAENTRK